MNLKIRTSKIILTGLMLTVTSFSDVVTLNFKDSVLINDSLIKISDIADVESSSNDYQTKILSISAGEAAPPGFSRFIGVNDLVLFRLQPLFKEITFKTVGCSRVLVKTDCIEKRLGDFRKETAEFLKSNVKWPEGSWSYSIDSTEQKIRCMNAPLSYSFHEMLNKYPKGNTKMELIVEQGSRKCHVPFICNFKVTLPVLVCKNQIDRGKEISKSDCELEVVDITQLGPTAYTSIDQLTDKIALRTITPGTIIHNGLIRARPVIEKGDIVFIRLKMGKVKIEVSGVARENGGIGDRIWVENSSSHKLIRASIKEKGIVVPIQGGETT